MENIELTDWETILLATLVDGKLERLEKLLAGETSESLVNMYQKDIEELKEINRKLGFI